MVDDDHNVNENKFLHFLVPLSSGKKIENENEKEKGKGKDKPSTINFT